MKNIYNDRIFSEETAENTIVWSVFKQLFLYLLVWIIHLPFPAPTGSSKNINTFLFWQLNQCVWSSPCCSVLMFKILLGTHCTFCQQYTRLLLAESLKFRIFVVRAVQRKALMWKLSPPKQVDLGVWHWFSATFWTIWVPLISSLEYIIWSNIYVRRLIEFLGRKKKYWLANLFWTWQINVADKRS